MLVATEFSLGGRSPFTLVQTKQIRIIYKTKQYNIISAHVTITPTQLSKHPNITKQVTTTVQDTHQMK
jgi:hypothetical protein